MVCAILQVFTVKVEKKLNEVVNRLNRTREEKYPNLQELREKRDREEQAELRLQQQEKVRLSIHTLHELQYPFPIDGLKLHSASSSSWNRKRRTE